MPDRGTGRVHRFRDHVVAGVNWRPTRFMDEVPNSRVCGLCRMIPKRMVLLPCSHALCQSCHAASFEGGVGQCPLDQVQFEEPECFGYDFPIRTANSLKVYCWNEARGCEFVGTMECLLRHYENECTFHTVECLRCGGGVLHKDLPTHYATGCNAGLPSETTRQSCSESTPLTHQDLSKALEDLKSLLTNPYQDELLPAVQSQMNELTEQVRSQEAKLAEIKRELRAPKPNLKLGMNEYARVAVSSGVSDQLRFLRDAHEGNAALPLRTEKALVLRKLEHFAHLSLDTLEYLRQNVTRQGQAPVIASCEPLVSFLGTSQSLTKVLSTAPVFGESVAGMCYVLTLENANEVFLCKEDDIKFAEVTVWHTRDTYFTIAIWKRSQHEEREKARKGKTGRSTRRAALLSSEFTLEIEFNGLLSSSQCALRDWCVNVRRQGHERSLDGPTEGYCFCKRDNVALEHFHFKFAIGWDLLKRGSFLVDGTMTFDIHLKYVNAESSST
ncbi:uncharacterized protein LOC119431215 isoform X2 [Dermacentor silvarum]|uniref:uncharacterized protein LOC119431215 isoform X2 n=1 Tax=Dermacentor silvarum TaxID=543639 RepID=UPI00210117A8|nr:uncharacterized protein LOC119431215 isoform X2 [Dermacentor silvarum]